MLLIIALAVAAFVALAILITRSALARSERREFAGNDSGYATSPSDSDASVSGGDGCTSGDAGSDCGGGDGGGGGD